jgi:hypothetical protein
MTNASCPGSGRKWQAGMGRAICPVCHRSAKALGATVFSAPKQWKVMAGKTEMIVQGITVEQFNDAVAKAGAAYADNLAAEIGSEFSRTRFSARVTIKETGAQQGLPTEELASGQRRSWSGRRIKAACWHAYRDVLVEVFNISPDANVYTTMAKYKGRTGFENEYPATADRNIGSMMQPAYMPELCDCCY